MKLHNCNYTVQTQNPKKHMLKTVNIPHSGASIFSPNKHNQRKIPKCTEPRKWIYKIATKPKQRILKNSQNFFITAPQPSLQTNIMHTKTN